MKFNLMSLGDHIQDPVTGRRPTAVERHRFLIEAGVQAEGAGFHGVNMGEHHGIDYIYSSPPIVLAAIGERTKTLRLGTAVTLLANLDALRIAEDYATLDAISGGRVEVVAGRGNLFTTTYTLFGQSVDESPERFSENAELLTQLWSGDPIEWTGRFRAPIRGIRLQPPPVQAWQDVMWIGGGGSKESVELAARLGWKLMLPSAFGKPEFFAAVVDHYLEKWEEHGHPHPPEIGAGWHAFVAPKSQDARSTWEPRYRAYHEWMQNILADLNPLLPRHQTRPFDFDWLTTEGPAIVGSPDEVVERIVALSEQLKVSTHLLYMDMGGMPQGEVLDAIDLIGAQVIPELADR